MFITFEGPEGSGKSTAIAHTAERLRALGYDVVTTREPGAGEFGKRVRELLLNGPELDPKAELMLFLADRAEHVAKIIRPALNEGNLVLCDRFADSTLVYQAYGRGLDLDFVKKANKFATDGLTPDYTLLFDIDPAEGLARIKNKDRLDREPLEFHRTIRVGFLREAHLEPRRWSVVDASRSKEEVMDDVVASILERVRGEEVSQSC